MLASDKVLAVVNSGYTRWIKRKRKSGRIKKKKVTVVIDKPKWIPWNAFPYKMLQKRYQVLLINHLKAHIQKDLKSNNPDPDLKPFTDETFMQFFFDDMKKEYENGFFVHITEERKDLKLTAAYVGRYARRPPISELRILDYTGEMITFEFKDHKNNETPVKYTLKTVEFIRKFVRHIPAHYFNVIRHYGLLASRVKTKYKAITDKLLPKPADVKPAPNWRERQTAFRGEDPLLCKICGKIMVFVSSYIPNHLKLVKAEFKAAFP